MVIEAYDVLCCISILVSCFTIVFSIAAIVIMLRR